MLLSRIWISFFFSVYQTFNFVLHFIMLCERFCSKQREIKYRTIFCLKHVYINSQETFILCKYMINKILISSVKFYIVLCFNTSNSSLYSHFPFVVKNWLSSCLCRRFQKKRNVACLLIINHRLRPVSYWNLSKNWHRIRRWKTWNWNTKSSVKFPDF